ncbi:MAG: AsmA-like C-terminal domain-containing protein [Stappiaceae bacterium]
MSGPHVVQSEGEKIKPPSRRRRKISRYVLLAAVVLLLAGIGRLYLGPVESDTIRDVVQSRLQPFMGPGNDLTIGAVEMDIFGQNGVKVVVKQASLSSWANKSSAYLPETNITLDRLSLLTGDIVVHDVSVVDPRLETQFSGGGLNVPEISTLSSQLENGLDALGERLKQYRLDSISIRGGGVFLNGEQDWKFDDLDAEIKGDTQNLVISGAFGAAGSRRRITLQRTKDGQTGAVDVVAFTPEVVAADFLPVNMEAKRGRGLGLPLSIKFASRFDNTSAFSEAMLNLNVGAGFLSFSPEDSFSVDKIAADIRWRQGEKRTFIPTLKIVSGRTAFDFRGYAEPSDDPNTEKWKVAFQAINSPVGPSDVGGSVLNLDNLYASALVDLNNRNVEIEAVGGRVGPSRISGVGFFDLSPGGPWLSFAGNVDPMPVESVKRLWPSMISPKTRRWFIKHISGGQMLGAQLDVVLNGLAFDGDPGTPGFGKDGLALDFSFEGATLHGIGELPSVIQMSGDADINASAFHLKVAEGLVRKPVDKDVLVKSASFEIPDLRVKDKEAILSLTLAGDAIDIGTALDQKPVLMGTRIGVDPANLGGTADITINTEFPLENSGDIEQFAWSIEGTVDKFSSSEAIDGQKIGDASLTLDVTPERAVIKGTGRLNGLKADIDIVQPLRESGASSARQGVALSITAKELKQNGIDLEGLVSGPMQISVNVRPDGAKEVSADLTKSQLNLSSVGWKKGKGVPAKASFVLKEQGEELHLEDFALTSDGVNIRGHIDVHADKGLQAATFDTFAFRQGDDASLKIKQAKGRYEIDLRARRFDGRGIITSLKTTSEDDASGLGDRATVSVKIEKMTGFNKASLFDLSARFDLRKDHIRSGTITGRLDDKTPLTVEIEPTENQRVLQANTGDAGKLLAFLDIYTKMRGGEGVLSAALDEGDNATGRIKLTEISIENDETVKELVGRQGRDEKRVHGTSIVIRQAAEKGSADFAVMEMNFSLRDDLLIVEDAIVKGPVVGGTASGQLDLSTQTIKLSGTFVPIYAVNSLFGKLPVIGQIVGGGKNGGLFAVTFALTGPIDDPQLRVNPVSALAPGIFRKIFEYR